MCCKVKRSVEKLLEIAHSGSSIKDCPESSKAAVRIHLFTLLFEDCSRLCVEIVEKSGAIGLMVQLISVAQETMQQVCNLYSFCNNDGRPLTILNLICHLDWDHIPIQQFLQYFPLKEI